MLKVQVVRRLSGTCLAPLAGSLRELRAIESAVDAAGVGALTGLRSLTLHHCRHVDVYAVARMRMLRCLDVLMDVVEEEDEFAVAEVAAGWMEAKWRGVAEVVGAPMAHLESVRLRIELMTVSSSYEDSFDLRYSFEDGSGDSSGSSPDH